MRKSLSFFFIFLGMLFSTFILAENSSLTSTAKIIPTYYMDQYDKEINLIYKQTAGSTKVQAIEKISNNFLGDKYLLGALGEGPTGKFDQQPLYRTDAFDCETLVETVMALANTDNLIGFKKIINKIRYRNGDVTYFNRNHFTSVDWNINNQENGFLKNITPNFKGYQVLTTTIDKPAWYLKHDADNLQLLEEPTTEQTQKLVKKFHAHAKKVVLQVSHLDYIPLSVLFTANGESNQKLFNQIPSGSVIEIVRNKNFVDITHMGLGIQTPAGLIFRQASNIAHKVIDIPLAEYLAKYNQAGNKTNVIGIHVEQII